MGRGSAGQFGVGGLGLGLGAFRVWGARGLGLLGV